MVSWIIPIVRQSKTDLIHRQEMRPLRHGGSHFVKNFLQNGCLHDVRDASLVCESSQFLTAWRLVLSMKPWSYIWLEFGLFSTIIYIYIYISTYTWSDKAGKYFDIWVFYFTERFNWSTYISVHCANRRNIVLPTTNQTMEAIKTYQVAKADWGWGCYCES